MCNAAMQVIIIYNILIVVDYNIIDTSVRRIDNLDNYVSLFWNNLNSQTVIIYYKTRQDKN